MIGYLRYAAPIGALLIGLVLILAGRMTELRWLLISGMLVAIAGAAGTAIVVLFSALGRRAEICDDVAGRDI